MLKFSKKLFMSTNREVFDQIAESWYGVRHWSRFRQELEELAQRWQGGSLLNVGCAQGADFLPFRQNFELFGIDFSLAMLRQAVKYSHKFDFSAHLIAADACSLPFPDNAFDWAVAVATYHHIQGQKEREEAFRELRRVLKPGGEAFLTVWNRGQPRFWFKSQQQKVPWKVKNKTLYRYYYLFFYGELRKLLTKVGFRVINIQAERAYHLPIKNFSRNICVLIGK
jgi:ubiquinone/menaquinone biosynthesis C-methylase UbiE